MDTNKKNILVIAILVCVILAAGIYYFYYGNMTVKDDVLPISDTSDVVESINDNNLEITPVVVSDKVPKTSKEEVIKNILDKKYDKAKVEIKSLLDANQKDPELWYIDSSLKSLLSDTVGAIASIDKALIYDPQNTTYLKWRISLIISKMVVGDKILKTSLTYINTVKSLYEDALKTTNSNIEIIAPYAIFLESIGEINQAISYWEKAMVINPLAKISYTAEIERLKAK